MIEFLDLHIASLEDDLAALRRVRCLVADDNTKEVEAPAPKKARKHEEAAPRKKYTKRRAAKRPSMSPAVVALRNRCLQLLGQSGPKEFVSLTELLGGIANSSLVHVLRHEWFEKLDGKYLLSAAGMNHLDELSRANGKAPEQAPQAATI